MQKEVDPAHLMLLLVGKPTMACGLVGVLARAAAKESFHFNELA